MQNDQDRQQGLCRTNWSASRRHELQRGSSDRSRLRR
jgi:hypothetical protein